MCEAGRILHHLRHRIGSANNCVLIVGWQAPDTLGRRLIEGISPVKIFGEEHDVHAQIEKMNGLSGHADGNELIEWVRAMEKLPRQTYLVHGEVEQAGVLAQRLTDELGLEHVHLPDLHEQVHFP
jgi:metallo-beta-lactamase family protein